MSPLSIGSLVFVSVFGAGLVAVRLRAALPQHHLSAESKDTVKLSMGLVATMSALVLGLLVASAKGSYDTEKSQLIAMSARVAFLDRVLAMYGPESSAPREAVRHTVEQMITRLWPDNPSQAVQVDPLASSGEAVYHAIHKLLPQSDEQRSLKAQALSTASELGLMRWQLFAQAGTSISAPLLIVVVCWLAVLFFSFGLFAPSNPTVICALFVAALSVAGAIFLILELDQPFSGLIRISNRVMSAAHSHLGQ